MQNACTVPCVANSDISQFDFYLALLLLVTLSCVVGDPLGSLLTSGSWSARVPLWT